VRLKRSDRVDDDLYDNAENRYDKLVVFMVTALPGGLFKVSMSWLAGFVSHCSETIFIKVGPITAGLSTKLTRLQPGATDI